MKLGTELKIQQGTELVLKVHVYLAAALSFCLLHTEGIIATVLLMCSQYTQKHRALRGGGGESRGVGTGEKKERKGH